MRELIKKWRKRGKKNAARIHYKYADELRAALPVWTKIDIRYPSQTFPEIGSNVLVKWNGHETPSGHTVKLDDADAWNGYWWRPLIDIDYPPENEDG